jgi:hypothetical protein
MNSRLNKLSYFLKIASEDEDLFPPLSEREIEQSGSKSEGYQFSWADEKVTKSLMEKVWEKRRKKNPGLKKSLTLITPGQTLCALEKNPEIKKWFEYVRSFKIPDSYKYIVVVPCSASKPWGEQTSPGSAKYYKAYWDVIKTLREQGKDDQVYWLTISEPLGIIPQDNWDNFPAYDNPGLFRDPAQRSGLFTRDWIREYGEKYILPFDEEARSACIDILGKVIADFFINNNKTDRVWLSLVAGTKGKVTNHTEMLDIAKQVLEKGNCSIDLRRKPKGSDEAGRPTRKRIKEYTEEQIAELLEEDPITSESKLYRLQHFLKLASKSDPKNRMKTLLILIHPDAVIDRGVDLSKEYFEALKANVNKFDHLIVNAFYSDGYEDRGYMSDDKKDIYLKIVNLLKNQSNLVNYETDLMDKGAKVFESIVFNLIADNESEGLKIYMSGGNQDLCLQERHNSFCRILGDIISDNITFPNITYSGIYSPLVYRRKLGEDREAGIGLGLPANVPFDYPGQFSSPSYLTHDNPWWKDPKWFKKKESRQKKLLYFLKISS